MKHGLYYWKSVPGFSTAQNSDPFLSLLSRTEFLSSQNSKYKKRMDRSTIKACRTVVYMRTGISNHRPISKLFTYTPPFCFAICNTKS